MTTAEAMVYAAAFAGADNGRRAYAGYHAVTRLRSEAPAGSHENDGTKALRMLEDASEKMLAEFRAFGQETKP